LSDPKELRIALFVDFENLVTNTGITPSSFDLQPSIDRLLEKGKVIYRRAYCDWARFREAKTHLHEHGVDLIDVPPSTRSGKNGADMRLVIDALELCYAREHINTFVIASGDSDFCPLAYKLRENDRVVIGLAVKQATSPMFVKACDEFIYLQTTRGGAPAAKSSRPARGGGGGGGGDSKKREVPALAREVVSNLLSRATGPLNPSFIKVTLVREEPDFDEREHGFSSFSRMLEVMEIDGLLKRMQQGRQWYVVPVEGSSPQPSSKEDASEPDKDDASEEEEVIPDPED
jgi:uncharacterized LabA/DUF88 family protein